MPNPLARGTRVIDPLGFESTSARVSAAARAFAMQDRINRAFPASDAVGRVMKVPLPVTTTQRLDSFVRASGVHRAYRDVMPRSFDVARAYPPVNMSDALRDAVKAHLRPDLIDAVNRRAGRGITETVCSSVKAQTVLGLRDVGGVTGASLGRRWAVQHRATWMAGLRETFTASRGLAASPQGVHDDRRRALLNAALPTIRPFSGLRVDGLAPWRARTDAFEGYRRSVGRFAEFQHELSLFIARWEANALWFLMSSLGIGVSRVLSDLPAEEAEEAVLDALDEVVRDGKFTQALGEVIADHAPHLTPVQRHHLKTFLRHAGEGDWLTAVPPMMVGLEGAFHSAARDRKLITARGTYVGRPNKKVGGPDAVIKLLPVDDDYEVFMIRRLFGGTGNPHRHGTAEDGERQQVLMGVIGLAGWVDEFMRLKATQVLAREMERRLPSCAERRRCTVPVV